VGIVIGVVVVVMLTATYLTWLASRLDRLADRVDAVRLGLITQLCARAAAALRLAQICVLPELSRVALLAVAAHDRPPAAAAFDDDVTDAENALSRALHAAAAAFAEVAAALDRPGAAADVPAGPDPIRWPGPGEESPARDALVEVATVTARVGLARALYNDAVRDLRALRARRVVRVMRLAGGVDPPPYFEIDDVFATPEPSGSAGSTRSAAPPERPPLDPAPLDRPPADGTTQDRVTPDVPDGAPAAPGR
jgi:hypothetical protein